MLKTDVKGPLTLAGIVIGVSLLLGILGSYFLATQLQQEANAIMTARLNSARAATLAPRIQSLESQANQAAGYERVMSLLLPTQEQLLEMPRTIETLARSRNVNAQFQFTASAGTGAVVPGSVLPFSLSATGTGTDLVDFLRDLELNNPRYTISVAGVDYGSTPDGAAKINASGNVYYQ